MNLSNIRNKLTGIYEISCVHNQTRYIGQSLNIRQRLIRHRNTLRKGLHVNKHLQYTFNKYGEESFTCIALELIGENLVLSKQERRQISENILTPLENKYIQDTSDKFNKIRGQTSSAGVIGHSKVHTEETKEKIRNSKLGSKNPMFGKQITDTHRQRLKDSKQGKDHPMYGKTQSKSSRAKMKAAKPKISVKAYLTNSSIVLSYECLRDADKDGFSRGSIKRYLDTGKVFKDMIWVSNRSNVS